MCRAGALARRSLTLILYHRTQCRPPLLQEPDKTQTESTSKSAGEGARPYDTFSLTYPLPPP